MAKNKKSKFQASDIKAISLRVLGVTAGAFVGAKLREMVQKKDAVSGTDLLGLDGKASSYAAPAALVVLGAVGTKMMDHPFLKDVCLGVSMAGGVAIVNAAAGKPLVSLNGVEDEEAEAGRNLLLPGINGTPYEEIDDEEVSNEEVQGVDLPDNNEVMTTYAAPGEPQSELEMVEDGSVNGLGETLL